MKPKQTDQQTTGGDGGIDDLGRPSRRRLLGIVATGLAGAALTGVAALRLTLARSDDDREDDEDETDRSGSGGGGDDDDSGRGRGRGRGRGGREDGDAADAAEVPANVPIPAGSALVEIFNDDGFSPPTLTIDAGQIVTFVNLDGDDHTATGSAFDTGIIPEGGGSASVVLDTPGRYPYACLIHPEMVGELLVRDESGNVPERAAAAPPPAGAVPVQIVNLAFSPASVAVPVGGTVTWTNDDSLPHTATALDGSFDSGILDGGGTFNWTFEAPGTFAYQCALHPQMRGEVVVTGDGPVTSAQSAATPEATPAATPVATPEGATVAGEGGAAGEASVEIVDLAFEPQTITAPAGTEVVWTNTGQLPHTVTADDFSSDALTTGQTFRQAFTDAGTIEYFCAIHPNMTGRVVVEPA